MEIKSAVDTIDERISEKRRNTSRFAKRFAISAVIATAAALTITSCYPISVTFSKPAANCPSEAECQQNSPTSTYTTAPTLVSTLMATAIPGVEEELEHSELICSDYILTPTPSASPIPEEMHYNALARWELHNPGDAVPNGTNGETISMEQIIAQYFSGANPIVVECKIKTTYEGRLYDVIERHIDYNELENRVVVIDELKGCDVSCPTCYTPQAPGSTPRQGSTPTPYVPEEPGRTSIAIPTAIITDDPFEEAPAVQQTQAPPAVHEPAAPPAAPPAVNEPAPPAAEPPAEVPPEEPVRE